MKPTSLEKCAHVLCSCNATDKYCSEACKDSDSRETEIACACGHPGCDATVTADIQALFPEHQFYERQVSEPISRRS